MKKKVGSKAEILTDETKNSIKNILNQNIVAVKAEENNNVPLKQYIEDYEMMQNQVERQNDKISDLESMFYNLNFSILVYYHILTSNKLVNTKQIEKAVAHIKKLQNDEQQKLEFINMQRQAIRLLVDENVAHS